jgi:hypothetical protein
MLLTKQKMPNAWLECWMLRLQEYQPEIRYIKGKLNNPPDTLSRVPYGHFDPPYDDQCELTQYAFLPQDKYEIQQRFIKRLARGSNSSDHAVNPTTAATVDPTIDPNTAEPIPGINMEQEEPETEEKDGPDLLRDQLPREDGPDLPSDRLPNLLPLALPLEKPDEEWLENCDNFIKLQSEDEELQPIYKYKIAQLEGTEKPGDFSDATKTLAKYHEIHIDDKILRYMPLPGAELGQIVVPRKLVMKLILEHHQHPFFGGH